MRFIHLTADDGLAQNSVQAILQDRHGFLWIGTQNGLSRFDGYRFTTYRHDPQNPQSLSHNFVRALLEDREGRLWVAMQGGGADRYDPTIDGFRHYQRTPEAPNRLGAGLFTVFQDSRGHFWFGGPPDSGLTKLVLEPGATAGSAESEHFTHYTPTPQGNPGFPGGAIWEIVEDTAGLLWLAADQALVSLNPVTEEFTAYAGVDEERRLAALWHDAGGRLWVGGAAGLYQFDPAAQRLVLYPQSPARINDLWQDQSGHLWISTHGDGLYRFDPQSNQIVQHEEHHTNDPASLSDNRVTALWQDRSGLLWIGSDSAGLNRVAPRSELFTNFQHKPDAANTLANNRVTAITGSGDTTLWVGTEGVLNLVDLPLGLVTPYTTPVAAAQAAEGTKRTNTIYALYPDRGGSLWLGLNDNQVLRFDPQTAQFTSYPLTEPTQPRLPGPPSEVVGFHEDKDGKIWVVVNLGGLYRIDPASAAVTRVDLPAAPMDKALPPPPDGGKRPPGGPPPGRLTASAGAAERLWLGYGNGRLLPVDLTQPPVIGEPLLLPGVSIETIHVDYYIDHYVDQRETADPVLWLGTRNGLLRFEPATGKTQNYTERDGLPSALIVGILRDTTGYLWLSTDKGLVRFDPTTGHARTFDRADGLPGNEFTRHVAWQAPAGRLFFGGSNGVTAFDPWAIHDNRYHPPILITNLLLYNEPVRPGSSTLLTQPIWATPQLMLQHDQAIVTFEFAALDYAAPQKNRYRYKLDGLEEAWNSVGSDRRFATYTSLPAGQYTFRVQGSNSDGLWSDQEVALALTVLPPWWQTLWFRSLLVLSLGTLAYIGYQWRVRTIADQNRLLEVQVAQRTQALAESEARFRELATSAFEAILILDDGRIVDANTAATTLFGYPHAALVGKMVQELLTPWLPNIISTQPIAATSSATPEPVRTTTEVEGLTAMGRRIPLEVHWRAAPYQSRPAVIIALHDLSERKQVESQRQRMAALEERERIGRELHDDLGQIMGYMNVQAQTVRDLLEQRQDAQAKAVLNQLVVAAQEAHEDVRQYILGIRRQPQTEPADEPVNFVEALRHYLAQLQERHGLAVHLSLPTELATSPIAPEAETQLLRIIQEALTNVRKHAGVNSARLIFTQNPDALQVVIADEGQGFEAGNTRQETRDTLPHFGLAIMQERAASIGGEVEIRSTPGVGTEVIVNLPRQLAMVDAEAVRGLRVLLVDDHPLYLDGLRTMLAARGAQVVGMARDGLQAQQLAHTLYPDLILMDIEMPLCNGIEATRVIKSALPQIKIVMLTVAAEEATLFEALKLGASGYLLKNLDSGQFFHLLREVMRGETVLSPRLATQVLATFAQDAPSALKPEAVLADTDAAEAFSSAEKANSADPALVPTLTHRQQAVLKLVVQGLTNKEIAKELSITERTVKYHIGLILERLQLRSRYELARYAQEQGFTTK